MRFLKNIPVAAFLLAVGLCVQPAASHPHPHSKASEAPPSTSSEAPHEHRFHDIERWIERFEDPARAQWQKPDFVVEAMSLSPGENVADIGAATGYFTRRFAQAVHPGGFAVAADVEPGFFPYVLSRAAEEGLRNVFTVQAQYHDPMLEEAAFDVVFICNTLHHIDERASYYGLVEQALKPGGRFVVVDYFKDRELPHGPPTEMRLSAQGVVEELEQAGFRVELDTDLLPYQYLIIAYRG